MEDQQITRVVFLRKRILLPTFFSSMMEPLSVLKDLLSFPDGNKLLVKTFSGQLFEHKPSCASLARS